MVQPTQRAAHTRTREKPGGERRYVTRTRYTEKLREEWIAVPVPDAGVPAEEVDRARDALRHNEKCSSAGRRFWELSGGIFRCAECGRALVAVTSLKSPKGRRRRMFYYMCATRRQRGKHACSFSKSMNAQRAETIVWDAVSILLTDPKSLKSDLEAMIEQEKETRGDPERAEKALAASPVEAERKREKYQEMYAADAMTLEELRSRLGALEGSSQHLLVGARALRLPSETRNCSSSLTQHAPLRRWIASDPRSAGRYTLCSDFA